MIPHQATYISEADIDAVVEVLRSRIVLDWSVSKQFSGEFAAYLQTKACVATSTGTLALALALRICNVGMNDQVLVPSYICNDVLSAVRLVGAKPRLVDSGVADPNLDPTDAQRKSAGVKAIVVPHLFGRPADLDAMALLGLSVIEDCSHALGATWNGRPAGSHGDAASFSFHALKMITSGEGGMISANCEEAALRLARTQDPRYDEGEFQIHYHLSDVLAGLGLSQFRRLDDNVRRRREICQAYLDGLKDLSTVSLPELQGDNWTSSCMRFVIRHRTKTFDELEPEFRSRGVTVRRPVKHVLHRYRPYQDMFCPQAEDHYQYALSLPAHLNLGNDDVMRVVDVARAVLG